jgi:hypothetical protein
LKHHSYLSPESQWIERGNVVTIEEHPSGARHLQTVAAPQQGGLAGTRWADDGGDPTPGHGAAGIVEPAPIAVGHGQVFEMEVILTGFDPRIISGLACTPVP